MNRVQYIKKRSLQDDIETGRKGHKKAGRKNRAKVFRALRKSIKIQMDKNDFND